MRIKGALTLQDAYILYKSNNPRKSKHYVTKKEYLSICYEFNKEVARLILEEAEKIILPCRLSTVKIAKHKMKVYKKRCFFDYQEYKKTGRKTYFTNEHSEDYYAYVYWNKSKVNITNSRFYRFKFSRGNNRRLAAIMKEMGGHLKYTVVDKKLKHI